MRAKTDPLPTAVLQSTRKPVRTVPPRAWIVVLGTAAAALVAAFLLVGLEGNLAYVLPRRLNRVGAMILVAVAVAVSTVLFQTVTGNRILTPSIMGLDALYVLIQTVLVFALGARTVLTMPTTARFSIEVVLMVAFSWLLYRWLFAGGGRSLHLLLLAGIVFGVFFRGASSLLQRLMDPSEYIILQDLFFASFNRVDPTLLYVSALVVAGLCVPAWRLRHRLDVLALGRDTAVGLGVDHRRTVTLVLVICSVLVAVSTALVGPATFFGLLVSALAYQLCSRFRHAVVLPIAVLLGVIALVGGQLVLEQVFAFDTALSIVIEFTGGIVFLVLLLKGRVR
ncbi:Iron(III)-hydroxamate import system permease protein fhuB [Arthrobacter agilis]|uniref:iron chelate uptake ABC transporter family permease subunit n=1 Tax=Arthrobacter agilis TaxID=37921 RepID=UPI000F6CCE9C|nr:iron chelate uptake ABC transporter family permease subunit [Arthrobacter agilis]VDR32897.1 Iron(III)-hydroxamate import system permease protein fhuB [Arthrobacter agilis]